MSGSVINTSLSNTVQIGSTAYPNPVTITSAGTVAPATAGATAIDFTGGNHLTLFNQGHVSGAVGAAEGRGGYGLILEASFTDTIINFGTIAGGTGGAAGGGVAGDGGTGAYVRYGTLNNHGSILGGAGGSGESQGVLGGYGVAGYGAAIVNSGLIAGGYDAFQGNTGLRMLNDSTLTNTSTGTITGGGSGAGPNGAGAGVYQKTGSLTNSGTISGGNNTGTAARMNGGDGLLLRSAADVNHGTILGGSGYAYGGYGVDFANAGATLDNTGSITGGMGTGNSSPPFAYPIFGNGGNGVDMRNAGLLSNEGTITGGFGNYRGGYGVLLGNGGTLVNAGTIIGGGSNHGQNDAVELAFSSGTVVVDPGAVFEGNVAGYGRGNFVLEFAGTSQGTVSGIGTQFTGFNQLSFAAGASFEVSGNISGFDDNQVITGFTVADKIVLDGFVDTSYDYTAAGLVLNGMDTLDITGNDLATDNFTVTNDGANTTITLCFCAGTRLATPQGEVQVEDLRQGDLLLTGSGPQPVRWIGQSPVDRRFASALRSLPVCISAGALGDGLPRRDLRISPDHAIYLDGCLVQAGALVNGVSIFRDAAVPEQFTYYHIELDGHELLLAEGVQAESFVDNVDRMHFANWAHRAEPPAPIAELPYPRVKSQRQLPAALQARFAGRRAA